jgi:hypothetical protein
MGSQIPDPHIPAREAAKFLGITPELLAASIATQQDGLYAFSDLMLYHVTRERIAKEVAQADAERIRAKRRGGFGKKFLFGRSAKGT